MTASPVGQGRRRYLLFRNKLLTVHNSHLNGSPNNHIVKVSGVQNLLEEAESDVLLLLDACASGISTTDKGNGVTELIAARGFTGESSASHSFTRALSTELKSLASLSSFSVGELYNRIFRWTRTRGWMGEAEPKMHLPLHLVLTTPARVPRSIVLSPIRRVLQNLETGTDTESTSDPLNQSAQPNSEIENISMAPTKPKVPHVLISLYLEENNDLLDVNQCKDWLRSFPALAKYAKVEAVYKSN
jgi:hypothetical protein